MKSISNTYNDIARFWGRASLMIVSAFVKAVPRLKAKLASIETVEERNASSNTSRIAATQVSSESIGTYLGIEEIYFKNSSGFGAMLFSRKKTNSRYSHYSYTGRLSGSLYREAIRKIIENAQRYRFETFTRLKALQDNPSTHATTKLIKDKTEELEGLLWVILFGDVSGPSFNSAFAEVLHYSTTIKPSDNRIHHYHDSVKNQFEKFSKATDPRAYWRFKSIYQIRHSMKALLKAGRSNARALLEQLILHIADFIRNQHSEEAAAALGYRIDFHDSRNPKLLHELIPSLDKWNIDLATKIAFGGFQYKYKHVNWIVWLIADSETRDWSCYNKIIFKLKIL